jgi:hypothetical protein
MFFVLNNRTKEVKICSKPSDVALYLLGRQVSKCQIFYSPGPIDMEIDEVTYRSIEEKLRKVEREEESKKPLS